MSEETKYKSVTNRLEVGKVRDVCQKVESVKRKEKRMMKNFFI